MTIVEFFDKDSIENVVSTLLCNVDRVVFIGYNKKAMERAVENYETLATKHNKKVEFLSKAVERNNLMSIVNALNNVVEDYECCTIDLAGGEDLYLVAAGIVYCNAHEKVQLHRFNINNGILYDCDADGNVIESRHAVLTVEENIAIYGGRVVYDDEKSDATYIWDFNTDFISDINKMWDICTRKTKVWNKIINLLDKERVDEATNALMTSIDCRRCHAELGDTAYDTIPELFSNLARKGLISRLSLNSGCISFECKNAQVKRCLTNAGQMLELKTTLCIRNIMSCGQQYNDVLTGVSIDWDGVITEGNDVENEIDVIIMKGLVPVFVSCKNGHVDVNELYKLNTVANRFGGKYAKKALVTSYPLKEDISIRAHEMGIRVIDNVRQKDDALLEKAFSTLA